ncbi:MAG: SH3 domain-containing protein [Eubacteriales bacterium]|nr:SH3 domain-containing protein [Eubacteriales bacterium]
MENKDDLLEDIQIEKKKQRNSADRSIPHETEYQRVLPKRPKAEPGVRIRGVFIPNVLLRRALIALLALIALIVICLMVRGTSGRNGSDRTASASTASQADARALTPEEESVNASVAAEEAAAEEQRAREDSVLDSYENLGVVNTSGGYINLRSAPDSVDMTNIIGKLANRAACDIVSTEGDWALVSSGGIRGYASLRYIATGDEARELARPEIRQRAIVGEMNLRMRTSPDTETDNVIGKALPGERYEILSLEGDWALIKLDASESVGEAYINVADGNAEITDCLDEAKRLDLREMALTQFDNLVVSNTGDYLNIRETPKDEGINNICGKFPSHAGAELLETVQADNGSTWYKIRSGGVTGYVSADYCATGARAKELAVEGAVLTAEVNTESLNVRAEPSTDASVWTQVVKGQQYHVLNQLDGWVEIELDAGDSGDAEDKSYISTRDNNVEVRYGLPVAIEYHPAIEAANAAASFRNQIVNYACQFVGNPYVWGGTSLTNGADCSGFTMKVLEHFGISIPRVSRDQARAGVKVTSANMKPGDLVFYANKSGTVNHVGMYIGNGQVVNAASRRSGIRIYRWNYRTPVAIRNVIGD